MRRSVRWTIWRALLLAPFVLYAGAVCAGDSVESFHIGESRAQLLRRMGPPKLTASISPMLDAWQFGTEEMEEGEFSHSFFLDREDGVVRGMTRTFARPRLVDDLFPVGQTILVELAQGYRARARRLPDGCWLMAPGSTNHGELVSQVIVLQPALLKIFYPRVQLD